MANITRAQLDKFNKALHNGFTLDLQHFIFHSGEKQAAKKVDLGEAGIGQEIFGVVRQSILQNSTLRFSPLAPLRAFSPVLAWVL